MKTIYQLITCFRPLSGFSYSKSSIEILEDDSKPSFRPLSGFSYSKFSTKEVTKKKLNRFPSPLGVLLFQIVFPDGTAVELPIGFRPLSGFSYSKLKAPVGFGCLP